MGDILEITVKTKIFVKFCTVLVRFFYFKGMSKEVTPVPNPRRKKNRKLVRRGRNWGVTKYLVSFTKRY